MDIYFNSPRPSRANSIYSLSRASFTAQLNQLTSLKLPDASTLSSTVAGIPKAPAAARALGNAAMQIQRWIQKAHEVLSGLDADDDIEWAAQGGKEGLDDMQSSIKQFEVLVNVFIKATESLQLREDIKDVPKAELDHNLDTLDGVVSAWASVGKIMAHIRSQVEWSLEFEELWNTVIGEISQEIGGLEDLVFEMEERRNNARNSETNDEGAIDSNVNVDIQELQTIVEETSATASKTQKANNRLSLLPALPSPTSPNRSPTKGNEQRDSSLMELFARLQPLRASLDFLPMRLASFRSRAEKTFPTGCKELEGKRDDLEKNYNKLQASANSIREELEEDHWIASFRNADRQVRKMCKSIEYGIAKLQETLEAGSTVANPILLQKRINDYEAKKDHYASNLHKVIRIIDTGVRERQTVNGEVLRIQSDAKELWETLQGQIREVDSALEELSLHRSQQLRESVSSIVSTDLSTIESTIETPGSSPASSVHMGPSSRKSHPATPEFKQGSRTSSVRSVSGNRSSTVMGKPRTSSNNSLTKRFSSNNPIARLSSASPSPSSRGTSNTPTPSRRSAPPSSDHRPRWNMSARVDYKKDFGHYNYSPLALKDGNPHSRSLNGKPLTPKQSTYASHSNRNSSTTKLAHSSPVSHDKSPNGIPCRPASRASTSMGTKRPNSYSSPISTTRSPITPRSADQKSTPETRAHAREYKPTTPNLPVKVPASASLSAGSNGKKGSLLPIPSHLSHTMNVVDDKVGEGERSPTFKATLARRPATSMAVGGRRSSSLLPVPK